MFIVDGEPIEVTEIRAKILDKFKDLVFEEGPHIYYLKDNKDRKFKSVTTRLGEFEEEFNAEEIAEKYAQKHGETKEHWLDEWKFKNLIATTTGSMVHEYGESLLNMLNGNYSGITPANMPKFIKDKKWLIPTRPKEKAILKFVKDLNPNLHFVLAEAKMYTEGLKEDLAGTADILFYYKDPKNDSKSGLCIFDYKGLPLDTPIATEDGWSTMGEIKEGDKVFDKNGNLTTVIHTSEIHHNPCYKIIFDNGEEVIADCDHRWEITYQTDVNTFTQKVLTTKEIYDEIHQNIYNAVDQIPKIMNPKPINCKDKTLLIDPYVLGCWLVNVNSNDSHIRTLNDEVFKEIERRGYGLSDYCKDGTYKKVYGLDSKLKELNLINNKHIPDIYLRSSHKQRLDLLRGLMDGIGYYDKPKESYILPITKEWEKDGFIELLGTLGIKWKIYKETNDTDVISFLTDVNPFLIKKINAKNVINDNSLFRLIVSVEETKTVPTRCIEVDSDTHTFCFGKSMVVTHNTNKELIKDFSHENGKLLLPPFNDYYEEPKSIYTLQLSTYSIPLQDLGFKIIARRLVWLKDDETYELIPLKDESKRLREIL